MIGRNGKIELVEVWKWKMGAIPKYLRWLRNMQDLGYRLTFREKGKAVLGIEDGYSYTKVMAVVVKEA